MTTYDPSDGTPGIDIEIDPPSPPPFETRCPSCGNVYALPTAVCRACAEGGCCTVCAGPHRATQCPHVWRALSDPDPDPTTDPWPDAPFPYRWSGTARRWLLARGVAA